MQVVNFARADRLLVETKAHLEMSKSDLDRTNSVFVVRRRSPKRQTPAMCIGGAALVWRCAEEKIAPAWGEARASEGNLRMEAQYSSIWSSRR